MNHKSFVFFDCECANNFDGKGKICSLGYVICDDDLNIIESEDVVINPECEFDWYLFSSKSECQLAYSKDYFRSKPNFESYYKSIKKLLTTGNRYIAGFSVKNDIHFLNDTCERYNLPFIQLHAFDVENFLNRTFGQKKKLLVWAESLGVNVEKYQNHKSEDDAILTMLCIKSYCKKNNILVDELFSKNKNDFISSEQILLQTDNEIYKKEVTEKINRLFGKKSPKPRFKTVLNKKFAISKSLMNDVDVVFELVKKIYENGGTTFEVLNTDGFIVFEKIPKNDEFHEKLKEKNQIAISIEELFEKLK